MARALLRARSATMSVNAFSLGLSLLVRAREASVIEIALRAPFETTRAISAALAQSIVASGFEHGCRVGFVRQWKACDQCAVAQRHLQMAAHRQQPSLVNCQLQCAGAGSDERIERMRFGLRCRLAALRRLADWFARHPLLF